MGRRGPADEGDLQVWMPDDGEDGGHWSEPAVAEVVEVRTASRRPRDRRVIALAIAVVVLLAGGGVARTEVLARRVFGRSDRLAVVHRAATSIAAVRSLHFAQAATAGAAVDILIDLDGGRTRSVIDADGVHQEQVVVDGFRYTLGPDHRWTRTTVRTGEGILVRPDTLREQLEGIQRREAVEDLGLGHLDGRLVRRFRITGLAESNGPLDLLIDDQARIRRLEARSTEREAMDLSLDFRYEAADLGIVAPPASDVDDFDATFARSRFQELDPSTSPTP